MDIPIKVVVLAAGKGTRLNSDEANLPKVMRRACGRPLLSYVLRELSFVRPEDTVIVVGYMKEAITSAFEGGYLFAEQAEQLGTGHAVMSAAESLKGFEGTVLVCYGDMPLLRGRIYRELIEKHIGEGNDCTILTSASDQELPYGRVIRDAGGGFERVVEDRDCTPEQKAIRELNVGIYAFRSRELFETLGRLKNNNAQGEYYLTDVPEIIRAAKGRIGILKAPLGMEILGVNTPEQLAQVEQYIKENGDYYGA